MFGLDTTSFVLGALSITAFEFLVAHILLMINKSDKIKNGPVTNAAFPPSQHQGIVQRLEDEVHKADDFFKSHIHIPTVRVAPQRVVVVEPPAQIRQQSVQIPNAPTQVLGPVVAPMNFEPNTQGTVIRNADSSAAVNNATTMVPEISIG